MLDVPLPDPPRQDMLQNTLSGWCAHYGHSLNCGILLDCLAIYRLVRLPLVLDSLFNRQDQALMCVNSNTAICLICGTTVCLQSNCCIDEDYNNQGECNESMFIFLFLCVVILPLSFSCKMWRNYRNILLCQEMFCVVSQFE